jgi:hypothetical protein
MCPQLLSSLLFSSLPLLLAHYSPCPSVGRKEGLLDGMMAYSGGLFFVRLFDFSNIHT